MGKKQTYPHPPPSWSALLFMFSFKGHGHVHSVNAFLLSQSIFSSHLFMEWLDNGFLNVSMERNHDVMKTQWWTPQSAGEVAWWGEGPDLPVPVKATCLWSTSLWALCFCYVTTDTSNNCQKITGRSWWFLFTCSFFCASVKVPTLRAHCTISWVLWIRKSGLFCNILEIFCNLSIF